MVAQTPGTTLTTDPEIGSGPHSTVTVPPQTRAGYPGMILASDPFGERVAPPVSADLDASPRLRTLVGVCGWAAVLGTLGLVIGVRGFWGIAAGDAPSWYEPWMVVIGVGGIMLTVGSFLTAHRQRAPWILLGAATVTLGVAMLMTIAAF